MDDFDFLQSLGNMTTADAVGKALSRQAGEHGFPTFAAGGLPGPQDPWPTSFLVHNWPDEWDRMYAERNFGPHDPVRKAVTTCSEPITISEIKAGKAGFIPTPEGLEMLQAATEMGRGMGLVVPIFAAHGYLGLVCFAGTGPEPAPRLRARMHMWAIYAHNRMRDLHRHGAEQVQEPLSEREFEILTGARNGLTDGAIARQHGITVRTVRFHFGNIRKKLKCSTRSEALAKAVSMHLL